jgi:DNA-binding CsgD family transcriptional regulator
MGQRAWQADPRTLERLQQVERLHLRGCSQAAIACELGVSERTIRRDLQRCEELWRARTAANIATLRARAVCQLDEVLARAWALADTAAQVGDLRAAVAALEVLRKTIADQSKILGLLRDEAPAGQPLDLPALLAVARAYAAGACRADPDDDAAAGDGLSANAASPAPGPPPPPPELPTLPAWGVA